MKYCGASELEDVTSDWADATVEDLSERLGALAEHNRLEKLGLYGKQVDANKRHYLNELRELLTELNYIAFADRSQMDKWYENYVEELEDL